MVSRLRCGGRPHRGGGAEAESSILRSTAVGWVPAAAEKLISMRRSRWWASIHTPIGELALPSSACALPRKDRSFAPLGSRREPVGALKVDRALVVRGRSPTHILGPTARTDPPAARGTAGTGRVGPAAGERLGVKAELWRGVRGRASSTCAVRQLSGEQGSDVEVTRLVELGHAERSARQLGHPGHAALSSPSLAVKLKSRWRSGDGAEVREARGSSSCSCAAARAGGHLGGLGGWIEGRRRRAAAGGAGRPRPPPARIDRAARRACISTTLAER